MAAILCPMASRTEVYDEIFDNRRKATGKILPGKRVRHFGIVTGAVSLACRRSVLGNFDVMLPRQFRFVPISLAKFVEQLRHRGLTWAEPCFLSRSLLIGNIIRLVGRY